MPLYDFHCPQCGARPILRLPTEARNDPRECPSPEHVGRARPLLERRVTAPQRTPGAWYPGDR